MAWQKGNLRCQTHGESIHGQRTRLYRMWAAMRQRCRSQTPRTKPYYFDKGIRVCPEWTDYLAFKEWALANGFADGLTIDRIDNDLGYSPDNCRFVTYQEQAWNRRTTKIQRAIADSQNEWNALHIAKPYSEWNLKLKRSG